MGSLKQDLSLSLGDPSRDMLLKVPEQVVQLDARGTFPQVSKGLFPKPDKEDHTPLILLLNFIK